jgi:glycosyltransferase A (GT-A) superfamily protein (DUF2064 family)
LPVEYIDLAFSQLKTTDAVLGPSSDGGYYLIGFSKDTFLPEAFDGVDWSSERVCEQTLDILKQHHLAITVLPQWHDVDNAEDLKSLYDRNIDTAFSKSLTMCYLRQKALE